MFCAFEEELLPVNGIKEALHVIIQEICGNICVASSGSHQKIQKTLSLTALYSTFEGRIFSGTDVQHGKPAPDLFLKACCELGSEVSTTVVIEDALPGVEAAVTARMKVLAYTPNGNSALFREAGEIVVPYYSSEMCNFICTIPEQYLKGRKIQIEYLKKNCPEVARMPWQRYSPLNLYQYYWYNNTTVHVVVRS